MDWQTEQNKKAPFPISIKKHACQEHKFQFFLLENAMLIRACIYCGNAWVCTNVTTNIYPSWQLIKETDAIITDTNTIGEIK